MTKRPAKQAVAAVAETKQQTRAQLAAEVFLRHHDAGVQLSSLARIHSLTVGDILDLLAEHKPVRRQAEFLAASRAGENEGLPIVSVCQVSAHQKRAARAVEMMRRGMALHVVAERTGLTETEIQTELSK